LLPVTPSHSVALPLPEYSFVSQEAMGWKRRRGWGGDDEVAIPLISHQSDPGWKNGIGGVSLGMYRYSEFPTPISSEDKIRVATAGTSKSRSRSWRKCERKNIPVCQNCHLL